MESDAGGRTGLKPAAGGPVRYATGLVVALLLREHNILAFGTSISNVATMTIIAAKRDNRQLRADIPLMKKVAEKRMNDPEKARRFLIKGGFMTKGGKLPKRYGG